MPSDYVFPPKGKTWSTKCWRCHKPFMKGDHVHHAYGKKYPKHYHKACYESTLID